MRSIIVVALLVACAPAAQAACRQSFDCSSGTCRPIQLCDNALDVPGISTPTVPPIATPSVRPIGVPTVPPVGTSSCRQVLLPDGQWTTACR